MQIPDAFLETDLELSEERRSEVLKLGGKKNNLLAGSDRFLGEGEVDWLA